MKSRYGYQVPAEDHDLTHVDITRLWFDVQTVFPGPSRNAGSLRPGAIGQARPLCERASSLIWAR